MTAVDEIRKIRDQLYEETKDMTTQELLAYIHKEAMEFLELMRNRGDDNNGSENHSD